MKEKTRGQLPPPADSQFSTSSTYTYDVLDRVTNISHALNGTTRTLQYDYDSVGNRKWTKRDGANGDVFGYDLNDQVTATLLNVANPNTTPPGAQTISYDANGNRVSFAAYNQSDTYVTNNLNQYSSRTSNQATYDANGNMATGVDGSTYVYDAQNRLKTATKGSTTETFKYDGLNRQVSRTIGAGSPVYNVYDGWELIAEYAPGATSPSNAYLSGPGGLVKNLTTNRYYYQDASGSTSHLASNTGALLESYRYDVQGTPTFYDPSNTQRTSGSAYAIRHLFTGQQWYSELGLYDLRNRYYSPDIGRFIQSDPIGFSGDATNLYRYCGNNPLKWDDPTGLQLGDGQVYVDGSGPGGPIPEYPKVVVEAPPVERVGGGSFGGGPSGGGGGGDGGRGEPGSRSGDRADSPQTERPKTPSPAPNPNPKMAQASPFKAAAQKWAIGGAAGVVVGGGLIFVPNPWIEIAGLFIFGGGAFALATGVVYYGIGEYRGEP